MKHSPIAATCAAALMLSLTFPAAAEKSRPTIGGHGDNVMAFVAQHDDSDDGQLKLDEYISFRRHRFDATDSNHDGQVDEREYVTEFDSRYRIALRKHRNIGIAQVRQDFVAMDTDHDGEVSAIEFQHRNAQILKQGLELLERDAAPGTKDDGNWRRRDLQNQLTANQRSSDRFLAEYDANQDGNVSADEFTAQRVRLLQRQDSNGNGTLDMDEALIDFISVSDALIDRSVQDSRKQTRVRYSALDQDDDAAMSFAEYQQSGMRSFNRHDRNADRVINSIDASLLPKPRPQREANRSTDIGGSSNG